MPKITKRTLDARKKAMPSEGQIFIRDTAIPGFGVRVTPGAISFVLEKKIKGRVRRITLGQYGVLTVDTARTKAVELCGRIAAGEDPAQERIDERHEGTFGKLMDSYMERHAKTRKKSWKNDEQMIKRHLEPWRNRRLSAITSNDISLLHSEVGQEHPYEANRLISLLRKAFNLATLWGYWKDRNPAQGIQLFREEKRDRFLQPSDELPRLLGVIKKEPNIFIQAALLLCLFLGQRKSELLRAKWEEINLDEGTWRIPTTKAGRPHLVPLPQPAVQILSALPHFDSNPYIFPGHRKGSHLVNIDKPWRDIRKKAELPDVRLHDLRRTLGSYLAADGHSLVLIGKALGHSQVQTTAVYARLNIQPVKAAMESTAHKILLLADKAPESGNGDAEKSSAPGDTKTPEQPTQEKV